MAANVLYMKFSACVCVASSHPFLSQNQCFMPPMYSNIPGIMSSCIPYSTLNFFEAGLKFYNELLFTSKAHNYRVYNTERSANPDLT